MKRFLQFALLLTTLFIAVSCGEKWGENEEITISATTTGFEIDGNKTTATWGSHERIALFSSAYHIPASFVMVSGNNTSKASFRGTITTQPEYVGVRPASSLGKTTSQTFAFSTSTPFISLDIEQLNEDVPQFGVGSGKSGIEFSPVFGAIEIPLTLNNTVDVECISISLADGGHPFYGDFVYRFTTDKISSSNGTYVAEKRFFPAIQLGTSGTSLFIALPQGLYGNISLSFPGYSDTDNYLIEASGFKVQRGCVTKLNPVIGSLPRIIGNWQLTAFCGTEADIDVVLSLNDNNTFTLYQRSGTMAYSVFTGTWAYNGIDKILSGRYSDGTSWAASYYVDLNDDSLKLTNTNKSDEVSEYKKVDAAPNVSAKGSRASNVKPIL